MPHSSAIPSGSQAYMPHSPAIPSGQGFQVQGHTCTGSCHHGRSRLVRWSVARPHGGIAGVARGGVGESGGWWRVCRAPVPRYVAARAHPHGIAQAVHVLQEAAQCSDAAGPPDEAAVQANRHHLAALVQQRVQCVLEVLQEVAASREARRNRKLQVVGVQRVRDDQVVAHGPVVHLHLHPVRHVIRVRVAVVHKAGHLLHRHAARVGGPPPDIHACQRLGGPKHALVHAHRPPHVLALGLLVHVSVVDPAVAVRDHLVARVGAQEGAHGGVQLQGATDCEHCARVLVLVQQSHDAPEAHAAAVLEHRLHVEVACVPHGHTPTDFSQECFGVFVSIQERVLSSLLVVHDQAERNTRAGGHATTARVAGFPYPTMSRAGPSAPPAVLRASMA
eukprot:CAMPEP_0177635212 /NCGR_PEP_ID=MMETSP0447-20121125/3782_1 /TAXON_ID=0 /ORGANISM="Stygamoeba regulata, Strain BSH-02190019" /LENGTH=390 /DNA_ID=CAMNT_0019136987 /DNA_START=265 /DNA_END=1434 /DNA_ORIENTATION=-